MKRKRNGSVTAIVLAMLIPLFGLVFLIVGAVFTGQMAARKKVCTFETIATVIDLERRESTDDDGDTVINYAPVYSYEYEGKSYTYVSDIASRPPKFEKGQVVKLLLDPYEPKTVYVPEDNSGWVMGIVFMAIGGVTAIAGFIVVLIMIRQSRKTTPLMYDPNQPLPRQVYGDDTDR
ncbi:MAG: DUF3592 domain-containing protein [Ruminococcus sp.]|nr:DUF3592 domain-containing protein [Ruminococcus sp.]